ncbi:MAG TPA: superoxide dismutase family protein [Gemmatimonadaceae bacterium]|nr:superoxide dismutase family protein [Gemmatimonadaceae bacterium]
MRQPLVFIATVLLSTAGCGMFGHKEEPAPAATSARAEMRNATGQRLGDLALTQTANGLLILGELNGLPPGTHGFHVHTVGKCDPTFDAAGAHFNPTQRQHGIRNPSGSHGGDLTNLNVPESGTLRVEAWTKDISLTGNNRVLDADGSALMIHALADDYTTDPSGASGARIACGVITP